jgi:hypothetical protein
MKNNNDTNIKLTQMQKKQNAEFPVVGYEENGKKYAAIGTAFFINDSGNFISAGHTFSNPGLTYYGIIENKFVKIGEGILDEYVPMMDQKVPTNLDLFIGRLDVKPLEHLEFASVVGLKAGDALAFHGYSSNHYADQKVVPVVQQQIVVDHDSIFADVIADDDEEENPWVIDENGIAYILNESEDEDLDDEVVVDEPKLEYNQEEADVIPTLDETHPDLERIRVSFLTGTFLKDTFFATYPEGNMDRIMTNGFSFKLANDTINPKGLSGCSVRKDELVYGMLIGKYPAISSDYIMDKLKEKGIKFTIKAGLE